MRHPDTSNRSELISINANIKPKHVKLSGRLFAEIFCSWSRSLIQTLPYFYDSDSVDGQSLQKNRLK